MIDSTMNGRPYRAARLAATLRRHLWREHLGLLLPQEFDSSNNPNAQPPNDCPNINGEDPVYKFVADPLGEELWKTWTSQATTNTEVFRFLFRADPDDNIKTFDDYDQFAPRRSIKQGHLHDPFLPVSTVRQNLDKIKGHLVWMPLDFLKDDEMAEPGLSVNQVTIVSPLSLCYFVRYEANVILRVFIHKINRLHGFGFDFMNFAPYSTKMLGHIL
jgi:phospholipase D1/2